MDIITALAIFIIGIAIKDWILNLSHSRAEYEKEVMVRLAQYAGRRQ